MEIFVLKFIFWLCIVSLVQVYILYPYSLKIIKYFFKNASSAINHTSTLPFVSVIIAAHNEELAIEEKILNTIALDYPKNKMEIWIGDDGSTDRTAEIAAKFSEVHLLKSENNEGKAATLNKLRDAAKGEIIMFSDANTALETSALRNLAMEFANERVGCVCGQLTLKDESGSSLGKTEIVYWKGESELKKLEGSLGAMMGSNGALYAIRSKLYSKLPTHKTVMDDFYITSKILMKNYACVFCEKARAFENTSASKYGEFKRKVRIGRANYNFLFEFLPLLNPLRPLRAYMFFSHKLLRWLGPFLILAVFLCSVFLMQEHIFYKVFLTLELFFVIAAFIGVRVCNYFLSMNIALFFGFCKSFFREKSGAWKRVERS